MVGCSKEVEQHDLNRDFSQTVFADEKCGLTAKLQQSLHFIGLQPGAAEGVAAGLGPA